MAHLLDVIAGRVLLCDGAEGTRIQALGLDTERDFLGHENCSEILNESRPDLVRDIHRGYLAAGADAIQTNSFGGSPITLGEFGIAEKAFSLNRRAAELAQEALAMFAGDGRTRFVFGSIGPGTKLPSLGHIGYDALERAYEEQALGLLAGGIDAFLLETCQDPLQIKAAVNGAKHARKDRDLPILVQVTVETTGTLLVGADIAAAATVVQALDVPVIGLNCATGPQEMAEHVRWLGRNWPGYISVQPNAGLPELVNGHSHYPLTPGELKNWLERFIVEDGVNLIGGCCGTGADHIAALDAMLRRLGRDSARPRPVGRRSVWVPSLASLYGQVPLRQENATLVIGERCNATGSKRWRGFQERADWDGCLAMAREQIADGSHALDVSTAIVGQNESAAMTEVVGRFRGALNVPLAIDSTELGVLEAGLKLYGGKALLNSINFEDGEAPAEKRVQLARQFGAAVIALTIDEHGMAKTSAEKVRIAHRLRDFACGRFGLAEEDLLIDPLTFTICTGNDDDRRLGIETLDAIARIAQELPRCQLLLGLSNISFGLSPAARQVLNSVFLDHAARRGLTGAILHFSKILPLHRIPEQEVRFAEDLIFDRRQPGHDPLQAFITLFGDHSGPEAAPPNETRTVDERLAQRIVEGNRRGLEADLEEALTMHPPLDIINKILLDGMKTVGDLFGAGRMQLPFVLQSAETMKAAVSYLEPRMERVSSRQKGTVVLATVRGDVHDIGKNLVDIILTNNGYRVVNLGIKQPIAAILQAANDHQADAIGMSGLLVKSTVVMRENLEEMSRAGVRLPVILGGAALTRRYVEEDCVAAYAGGSVAYARDAFDGLTLMEKVVTGGFDDFLAAERARTAGRVGNPRRKLGRAGETRTMRPIDHEEIRVRRADLNRDIPVAVPPFWGQRTIARIPLMALLPFLNERMLYQFQWGYRKNGRRLDVYLEWARRELRPILRRMLDVAMQQDIFVPKAVYGYWKCAADGNDVILFGEDGRSETARFSFPRQDREGGLCIADFFHDVRDAERDVIALQTVTIGSHASEVAREWFGADRYQDYLYLHGLSVELAEAMAEYVHKRIRAELGFSAEDARDRETLLNQGYRGSRYSFGYPACPNLGDQEQLLRLLRADEIGVRLSEEDQLDPEQSTSAIIVTHPQAKYFSV